MTEQTIPPQTEERGEPDSPLDLHRRDWRDGLRCAMREFKADRGTLVAAGMAFFWFLAIFPGLLAAVGITGLVNASAETVESIRAAVESALPGDAARVLNQSLTTASERSAGTSLIATIIGIAVALWSASAGMVALQTGLDVIYEVPQERPFLEKRLRALLLIGVAVLLGGAATALIVFGQPIGDAIRDDLPFGGGVFVVLWTLVRWVLGFAALATLFAAFYYLAPNRENPRWTWLTPGGAVATVIWLLASLGFSFYVSSLGSYGETYGSLTGVVVLLLWLFLSALAVLLGAELNAELERQGEQQRRSRPQPAPAASPPVAEQPDGYERTWIEEMRRIREGRR